MKNRLHSLILTLALVLGLVACTKAPAWQEQYTLGIRYLSEGNYEEAIIAFTAAIQIDPLQKSIYLKLGETYLATEPTEHALLQAQAAYAQAKQLGSDVSPYLDSVLRYAVQTKKFDYLSKPAVFTESLDVILNTYTPYSSIDKIGAIYDGNNGEQFACDSGVNIAWSPDTHKFRYLQFHDLHDIKKETAYDGVSIGSSMSDILSYIGLDPVLFEDCDINLYVHSNGTRSTGWCYPADDENKSIRIEYHSEDTEIISSVDLLIEDDRLIQAAFENGQESLLTYEMEIRGMLM